MNKVVRTHYPASRLPAELRGKISQSARVRVVIEEDELPPSPTMHDIRAMRDIVPPAQDDSRERIGKLRDEWD